MQTAAVIISIVFAVVLAISSVLDFRHDPKIVATMERLGLPEGFERWAGLTKVAAAAGLVVGLVGGSHRAQGFLTILVAWCLVAYFLVAVGLHVRVRDKMAETGPAIGLLALAAVLVAVS